MSKLKKDTKASLQSKNIDWPAVPAISSSGPKPFKLDQKSYAKNVKVPSDPSSMPKGIEPPQMEKQYNSSKGLWEPKISKWNLPALELGPGSIVPSDSMEVVVGPSVSPNRWFFYHKNCNDGLMSAVMAFFKYGNHYSDAPCVMGKGDGSKHGTCRYIPIHPEQSLDRWTPEIGPDDRVYYLDVFPDTRSVMAIQCIQRLIDHHKVNIERANEIAYNGHHNLGVPTFQHIGASWLTYERWVDDAIWPNAKKWARLVAARDVMQFESDREAREARMAYIYLNSGKKSLAHWVSIVQKRSFSQVMHGGESALEFYEEQLRDALKDVHKFKVDKLNVQLVNCSQVFFSDAAHLEPNKTLMNAKFRKDYVQIQLRGPGSQIIARKFGGNGHPRAAGARMTARKFMEVVYGY